MTFYKASQTSNKIQKQNHQSKKNSNNPAKRNPEVRRWMNKMNLVIDTDNNMMLPETCWNVYKYIFFIHEDLFFPLNLKYFYRKIQESWKCPAISNIYPAFLQTKDKEKHVKHPSNQRKQPPNPKSI